jgi:hypothetical protein
MDVNKLPAEIYEITSILTPADGVPLDQAIRDAELAGFQVLDIDYEKNVARIVWYKRQEITE